MKEKIMYKCEYCGKAFDKERDVYECEFRHTKKLYANQLLNDGFDLGYINYQCGFNWNLSDEIKNVTKDNCFIIKHWQCCHKPAYRIVEIDERGNVRLFGIGSWDGGYGNWVNVKDLKEPHKKEELYEYERK